MEINHRIEGDVTVLDLDPGFSSEPPRELIQLMFVRMLEEGKRRFVVNLSRLQWINSTALGLLIGSHRKVIEGGGEMVIAGANERITDLMRVVGILPMWRLYATEGEAIAELREASDA